MKKRNLISLIILALIVIFIIVILTDDVQVLYPLYLVLGLACFFQGYYETINISKLGFGITRLESFRCFIKSIIICILLIYGIYFYYQILFLLVYHHNISFPISNLIFLALAMFANGQLGIFLGNIKVNKIFGVILFVGILVLFNYYIYGMFNKIFINLGLFMLSGILLYGNVMLIRNIKIRG